jgi:hypothetical protein
MVVHAVAPGPDPSRRPANGRPLGMRVWAEPVNVATPATPQWPARYAGRFVSQL